MEAKALTTQTLVIETLDTLGLALAGHKHKWTTHERTLYETAIKLLLVGDPQRQKQLLDRLGSK